MPQQNQWYGANNVATVGTNGMDTNSVVYAYGDGQDVQGVIHFMLPPGKTYDHLGIKVQFLGRITMVCNIEHRISYHDSYLILRIHFVPSFLFLIESRHV